MPELIYSLRVACLYCFILFCGLPRYCDSVRQACSMPNHDQVLLVKLCTLTRIHQARRTIATRLT